MGIILIKNFEDTKISETANKIQENTKETKIGPKKKVLHAKKTIHCGSRLIVMITATETRTKKTQKVVMNVWRKEKQGKIRGLIRIPQEATI